MLSVGNVVLNRQNTAITCECWISTNKMSVSGRLSSCSVVQEEHVARRMRKTPGTPIKTGFQTTPRKSESKRSLFQTNSPNNSDDLGLMSPLSASSCSSINSMDSPQFSPNGKLSTPPRTPTNCRTPTRNSPRLASRKIEVKSSLFPDLKLHTPKTRRTPRTPKTLIAKMLTPESKTDSCDDIEEGIQSLTPSTSRGFRRQMFGENGGIVAESDTSPSIGSQSQEIEENDTKSSDKPTKLGIKPLSCEDFYGPVPKPPKAKTKLFIDSLEPRVGSRQLARSLSRDSLSSNKSFVSGGTRKRTNSTGPHKSRRSKSGGRRAPHVGVWHNIKKPKQIKKIVKAEKPVISPKSRVGKMLKSPKKAEIKVKSKPLFQEYPRKRIAHKRKRSSPQTEDDIIDSFPDHLIKRKKLPTSQSDVHPAFYEPVVQTAENTTPDPNKKFMKYGQTRRATFTLSDSVKLQISDGVMRLQTPKKRRKLYSGRKDWLGDFNDFEDLDNEMDQSIQRILNRLHSDKESGGLMKANVEVEKLYEPPVLSMIENVKATTETTPKPQRSPLKPVNLPTMIINDFDSDDNDENDPANVTVNERRLSGVTLAKTGNMLSYMTNILFNDDQDMNTSLSNGDSREDETENSPPGDKKYFSLFYKQNWNKDTGMNDITNTKNAENRKKILVPDDQYLIDAGQKSIGIVTCKKCGVMYQAGDFADEATHNNFHNHLSDLKFTGWSNERVVGKYPDGRVIMILNADPKSWWQKVTKIIEIVDQDLGFPEATVRSLFHKTVYLYINEKCKQIAGCLIAEECKVAYKMFPPLEGVEIDSCSKDPSPCKVGISRIWTALSHRRKGVASRMIECLQKTFFFGDIVPIDLIAFSVPSPSGKLLAQKVTGRQDFLVYGFA